MKRSWPLLGAALGTCIMVLTVFLIPPTLEETSAGWFHTQSTVAKLDAASMPEVQDVGCKSIGALLGLFPAAEISWKPSASVGGSTVTYRLVGKAELDDPHWEAIGSPISATAFRFDADLVSVLEGVLGILFGNDGVATISVIAVHTFPGTIWESEPSESKTIAKSGTLLKAGFRCLH